MTSAIIPSGVEMITPEDPTANKAYDIVWKDVDFTIKSGSGATKHILKDCWGSVPAGKICAVMGPSGSGKSSLLNVLAGRSSSVDNIRITGKIKVGGNLIDPVSFRKNIAYVMQDDALMATATPREALEFSAALRLPTGTAREEITKLVSKTLTELGLDDCADVIIGGALIKGISGGQRKRTSVGVEIITNPSLLFLDEPTSGLDSFSAYNCVNLLKDIARKGAVVLCTIHQPSSEVFVQFDNVIFMKEGKIMYQGPTAEVKSYFSKRGFECPENYNPSDYVMFVNQTTTTEELDSRGLFMARQASTSDLKALLEGTAKDVENGVGAGDDKAPPAVMLPAVQATFATQFYWLTIREARNTKRDVGALIGRFGITIFLNLLFGLIFLGIAGEDNAVQANLQSHFGAVTFVLISSMFGSAQPIMLMFPFERPLFMREYSTGTYSSLSYFMSKIALELPLTLLQTLLQFILVFFMMNLQGNFIYFVLEAWGLGLASSSVAMALGASVSNVKDVTELAPLLFVPQLLFAGFFIRTSQIPVFLRWAQYLCSIKYAINLALITEFNSDLKSCQGDSAPSCQAIIDTNDIEEDLWWVYVIVLIALFIGFRLIAALILVQKAKRFY